MVCYELFVDHIFEKVKPAVEALGMECQCLGGGKIEHKSHEKKIRVFGESTVSHFSLQITPEYQYHALKAIFIWSLGLSGIHLHLMRANASTTVLLLMQNHIAYAALVFDHISCS